MKVKTVITRIISSIKSKFWNLIGYFKPKLECKEQRFLPGELETVSAIMIQGKCYEIVNKVVDNSNIIYVTDIKNMFIVDKYVHWPFYKRFRLLKKADSLETLIESFNND